MLVGVVGAPCSGKATLAAILVREHGFKVIVRDEPRRCASVADTRARARRPQRT